MNDLDMATTERPAKRFRTAQAKAAICGWRLLRTHPEDEPLVFALGHDGMVLTFRDAEAAMQRLCDPVACQQNTEA